MHLLSGTAAIECTHVLVSALSTDDVNISTMKQEVHCSAATWADAVVVNPLAS